MTDPSKEDDGTDTGTDEDAESGAGDGKSVDGAEEVAPGAAQDLPSSDDPGHALPDADLQYPTLEFEEGRVEADGTFDLSADLDRDAMGDWATALAGALASHDLGVETPDGVTTLGIAPEGVEVSFDPDEDHRGDLEITFRLSAKAMFVDNGSDQQVGARADAGFVPLSMLTDERDVYRCYSWIDDPEDPD